MHNHSIVPVIYENLDVLIIHLIKFGGHEFGWWIPKWSYAVNFTFREWARCDVYTVSRLVPDELLQPCPKFWTKMWWQLIYAVY